MPWQTAGVSGLECVCAPRVYVFPSLALPLAMPRCGCGGSPVAWHSCQYHVTLSQLDLTFTLTLKSDHSRVLRVRAWSTQIQPPECVATFQSTPKDSNPKEPIRYAISTCFLCRKNGYTLGVLWNFETSNIQNFEYEPNSSHYSICVRFESSLFEVAECLFRPSTKGPKEFLKPTGGKTDASGESCEWLCCRKTGIVVPTHKFMGERMKEIIYPQ